VNPGARQSRQDTDVQAAATTERARADRLPAELVERCAALEDVNAQGEGLTRMDYVLLVVATLVLPAIMVAVGSVL
jgi:hypothetical protein